MTAGVAGPVRAEDAFDIAPVHGWLQQHTAVPPAAPHVRQFRTGASNLTYLLQYDGLDLVLRRPPPGRKARAAHDMSREYLVQAQLAPAFPHVPAMRALCTDESVIGSQFYVMDHVPGAVLDANAALDDQQLAVTATTAFDLLADLHQLDVAHLGLESLSKGPGYVRRQVDGWSRRYRDTRTPQLPSAERLMAWLDEQAPQDSRRSLVHGDWRLDNMIVDPADPVRIRAVLDWEMATIGDPLMDLGASLAYWVQVDDDATFQALARQPSMRPGMPTREAIVARYVQRSGLKALDFAFYEVFGLFRLAVIIAQIWWRFSRGQTTNPSFAGFDRATEVLLARAQTRATGAGG